MKEKSENSETNEKIIGIVFPKTCTFLRKP